MTTPRRWLSVFMLLPVMWAFSANAAEFDATQRGAMKKVMGFSGKPLSEFIDGVQDDLPPADVKYLRDLEQNELKGQKMPTMKMTEPDVIRMESGSAIMDLKILSIREARYKVNGHVLELANLSLEARVEKFLKALPVPRETGRMAPLIELLLPRAEAHPIIWLLLGLGGATGGAVWGNVSACKEIGETLDKCTGQQLRIEEWQARVNKYVEALDKKAKTKKKDGGSDDDEDDDVKAELKQAKDYKKMLDEKKKNASYCPNKPISKEVDDEAFEVTSETKRVADQFQAQMAQCSGKIFSGDQQRRLRTCYHKIEMLAKRHCLTKTKALFQAHGEESPIEVPGAPVPGVK